MIIVFMNTCSLFLWRHPGQVGLMLLGLLAWAKTVLADPPRPLAQHREVVLDVSLNKDSVLEGYLIDPFGKVLKETKVTLVQNRKVIWTGRTNAEGHFQVKGLSSGVYQVDSDRLRANCRIWANESAPPRASRSLLLTRDMGPDHDSTTFGIDDFTIRVSGFSTFTLPRMITRDVRKLMNP